MGSIQDNIRAGLLSGGFLPPAASNRPSQYGGIETQYLGDVSSQFLAEYSFLASNYISAEIQGLREDGGEAWETYHVRVADVVRSSATSAKQFDNYKAMLVSDASVEYIRPGTKIRMLGSVWIAVNPDNMVSVSATAIVQRCGTTWNYLDYYGNVCMEPIAIEKLLASANDPDAQETLLITKGYFNAKMQKNSATSQLRENSRMILGSYVYRITGFSDFQSEFTEDGGAVRMLEFTLRKEEPNDAIDDMERRVAGGKNFSWEVSVSGPGDCPAGGQIALSAASIRNGETALGTEEHPIGYVWTSSDETVAAVDENGLVRGVAGGQAVITAALAQNPGWSGSLKVTVSAEPSGISVRFTEPPPRSLCAYSSFAAEAAVYSGGQKTDGTVTWSAAGAGSGSYSIETDGNRAVVSCWGGSVEPLLLTAAFEEAHASASVTLEGL